MDLVQLQLLCFPGVRSTGQHSIPATDAAFTGMCNAMWRGKRRVEEILYAVRPGPAPCNKKCRSEHQTHFPLFGVGMGTRLCYHDIKVSFITMFLDDVVQVRVHCTYTCITQCLGVLLLSMVI